MADTDIETDTTGHPRIQQAARRLGPILWPSFLVAAAATGIFFAHIDPLTLRAQTLPDVDLSRQAGYTIGFLMFWAVCAASSALSVYLTTTDVPAAPQRARRGAR